MKRMGTTETMINWKIENKKYRSKLSGIFIVMVAFASDHLDTQPLMR